MYHNQKMLLKAISTVAIKVTHTLTCAEGLSLINLKTFFAYVSSMFLFQKACETGTQNCIIYRLKIADKSARKKIHMINKFHIF